MSENLLTLTIDGHEVKASADSSIIQAYARSGNAITANVGCMGQGVCGSCRFNTQPPEGGWSLSQKPCSIRFRSPDFAKLLRKARTRV